MATRRNRVERSLAKKKTELEVIPRRVCKCCSAPLMTDNRIAIIVGGMLGHFALSYLKTSMQSHDLLTMATLHNSKLNHLCYKCAMLTFQPAVYPREI